MFMFALIIAVLMVVIVRLIAEEPLSDREAQPSVTYRSQLTAREAKMLYLLADGLTNCTFVESCESASRRKRRIPGVNHNRAATLPGKGGRQTSARKVEDR